MSDLPAADGLSVDIALRSDGLHCVTGWRGDNLGNPHAKAWMWTKNPQSLREQVLLDWDSYLTNSISAFCANERLLVIGNYKAGGAPPIRIAEYSMTTQPFTKVEFQDFGGEAGRSPICCQLASGGVIVFANQHETPIYLKVAYRRPDSIVGADAALPARWGYFEFKFPQGEIPSMLYTVCQQVDGTIWLLMSQDGSGAFGLARFRENNGVIENIDFIWDYFYSTFIDGHLRDGDMSPGEELPPLTSTPDPAGGRILLCYPQYGSEFVCNSGYENNVIVAVYPDLRRELVFKLPDKMWKFTPVGCAWPNPKGVQYLVSGLEKANCAITWRTGLIQNGTNKPDRPIPWAIGDLSFCNDSYTAFNFDGKLCVAKAADLSKNKPV
jgi:hypothetical protein